MTIPQIHINEVPVRILLINGSPRSNSNSQWLVNEARKGIEENFDHVIVEEFRFQGKVMAQCKGCVEYCEKNKECVAQDGFVELSEMWLRADGIIWAAPVYTFGPPSQAFSWMERFGEIFMQNMRDKDMPFMRYAKPTGIMIQGSSRFGGQELTAQSIQQHAMVMDCLPVSGDMPHANQAVLGQVLNKKTPEYNQELLHAAYRMGVRVTEMSKLIKLGKLAVASTLDDCYWYSRTQLGQVERPTKENLPADEVRFLDVFKDEDVALNILALNASPRSPKRSHSQILLERARDAALRAGAVELEDFSFGGKKIGPCRMCIQHCSKNEECVLKDDFQEFRSKWLNADGIIWSVPIYHMGPPSIVRAAIDRMNELRFQTSFNHGQTQYPRLNAAGGVIVQGGSLYGGQEITMQFFMQHFMLLQCLPVTADMPESYMGVGGMVRSKEDALANEGLLRLCESLGQRVADMAKIKKAGMLLAQDSLPDEYFPSREKMGLIERRRIV